MGNRRIPDKGFTERAGLDYKFSFHSPRSIMEVSSVLHLTGGRHRTTQVLAPNTIPVVAFGTRPDTIIFGYLDLSLELHMLTGLCW